MFLLGAGASKDAGVPLARELTERILRSINDPGKDTFGRRFATEVRALNYVVSAILAYDGRKEGADPSQLPDIERVVSAVRLLSDRERLEVTPFIAFWDATVDTLEERPASSVGHNIGGELLAAITNRSANRHSKSPGDPRKIEIALRKAVETYTRRNRVDTFRLLYDAVVRALIAQLNVLPTATHYLAPLLKVAERGSDGLDVATLNYDLSIEVAAAVDGQQVSRGVDRWSDTGLLEWSPTTLRLNKLHGSIDWAWSGNRRVEILPNVRGNRSAALIFGRREKLRAEGPFLQLLEHFRIALASADWLVVIGYSFADEHINAVLHQWMSASVSRRMVLVDPHFSLSSSNYWVLFGHASVQSLDERWAFIRDYSRLGDPPRVALVNESCADFLPRLDGTTVDRVVDAVFDERGIVLTKRGTITRFEFVTSEID